jgi:hypothetical protein
VQVVSVYVDQLERQADVAPSPYQLAMTGAKVAPASAAKGIAGGLGRDHTVKTQPAPKKPEPSEKPEPTADLSRARAQQFGFRLCSNIPGALRCGRDRIAVDAVLAIVEQDDYPTNGRTRDARQRCATDPHLPDPHLPDPHLPDPHLPDPHLPTRISCTLFADLPGLFDYAGPSGHSRSSAAR